MSNPANLLERKPCLLSGIILAGCSMAQAAPTTTQESFIHPGLLNDQARLDEIFIKANAPVDSAIARGFQALASERFASLDYRSQAYAEVIVAPSGSTPSETQLREDAAAAYALALMWVKTGFAGYRIRAIEIIDAWASTYQRMTSNGASAQTHLESAWVIPVWANAAEILRLNSDEGTWSTARQAQFSAFLDKLYEHAEKASNRVNPSNWVASAGLAMMSVGVFQNDGKRYEAGKQVMVGMLPVLIKQGDGEVLELARDCWHPQYTLTAFVEAAEIALNQGDAALYEAVFDGDEQPRLAKGLEYMTRASLIGDQKYNCTSHPLRGYVEIAARYYQGRGLPLPNLYQGAQQRRPFGYWPQFPIWGTASHGYDY